MDRINFPKKVGSCKLPVYQIIVIVQFCFLLPAPCHATISENIKSIAPTVFFLGLLFLAIFYVNSKRTTAKKAQNLAIKGKVCECCKKTKIMEARQQYDIYGTYKNVCSFCEAKLKSTNYKCPKCKVCMRGSGLSNGKGFTYSCATCGFSYSKFDK